MTDRDLRRCAHLLRTWSDAIRTGARDAPNEKVDALMLAEAEQMRVLSLRLYDFARERRRQRRLALA